MKSIESGVTLIEVMASLIILSTIMGVSSGLVKQGIQHPFTAVGVENWISFIEISSRKIMNLDPDTNLQLVDTDQEPFNQLAFPQDLSDWEITWKESNIPNVQVARFKAITTQEKIIEWHIFKKSP